jgi:hypothetical protein
MQRLLVPLHQHHHSLAIFNAKVNMQLMLKWRAIIVNPRNTVTAGPGPLDMAFHHNVTVHVAELLKPAGFSSFDESMCKWQLIYGMHYEW